MYILAYTHLHLLRDVQIEVVFERQVVGIALIILATVILQVRRAGQPCLEVLSLHVGSVVRGSLERHLVDLLVGRDKEEVVGGTAVTIHVAAVDE